MVNDYKPLNEQTIINFFPIPLPEDIFNGLHGSKFFSTLDIKGAYHQILIDEQSRDYTAFTVGNFQYRYRRMPMGLATSAQTWQFAINTILSDLIGNGVFVYLDDVLIYAKSTEHHDAILIEVMKRLQKHNIQLKISKCIFFITRVFYLGHLISPWATECSSNQKVSNSKQFEKITIIPRNVRLLSEICF